MLFYAGTCLTKRILRPLGPSTALSSPGAAGLAAECYCCLRLLLLAVVSIFPTTGQLCLYSRYLHPTALHALVLVLWGQSVPAQLLGLLKATQAEASRVRIKAWCFVSVHYMHLFCYF